MKELKLGRKFSADEVKWGRNVHLIVKDLKLVNTIVLIGNFTAQHLNNRKEMVTKAIRFNW